MPTAADAGVLLVAAGRGVRAAEGGGGVPKQFRPVRGVPLLLRSLMPFLRHPRIGGIVIALPAEVASAPPAFLTSQLSDRVRLVAGGDSRQASVALALDALPPALGLVLVHDAARPFVDAALLDRVLAVAANGACAVPGQPLAETVKETDAAGLVVRTVPRERLVAVQTPQAFPRAMLETAHQRARADAAAPPATDDAALCERLGYPVRIVAGSPWNLKVTTPDDFRLAEAWAALGVPE
jgi:2-C-methyl-D-erythritol 4-phosphate cytidylyltransferase